jgi:sialidase-1
MPTSAPSRSLRVGIALLVVVSALVAGTGGAIAQSQESGQVIGEPQISFGTQTGEVAAGTATDLTITIRNRARLQKGGPEQHEERVTTARAMTVEFDDGNVPIDVDAGEISVGNVPTGATSSTVPITIEEGTDPGSYEIPVEYEYQYTRIADYDQFGVDYSDRTRTREGSITVEVTEDARFVVVDTDATAQIGDENDISLTLRNTGADPARDASVDAESQSDALTFDSDGSSSTGFVGDWPAGETRTVNYSVTLSDDAALRGYALGLDVDYTDTDGISRTSEPITTGVQTIEEQSFAFDGVDSTLRVGEDGTVTGTVTNTGPRPASNVVVRYTDDASTVTPREESVAVGTLGPGESADFRLPLEVSSDAEAGAKSLNFAVSYRNEDDDRRSYTKLDVLAEVAPERDQFEVALADSTIETGSTRTIEIEVTNNLDETATDIEGRLFTDDPLETGDSDTGYVQSLEPGETTTMTFELTAAASATPEKTYSISFDFRYDDDSGKSQLSDTIRVPIDTVEGEDGGLPTSLLLIGLVVVAGGGAVLWYRRQ